MANVEFDRAIKIANAVLDRPNIDPDDDICILARQFLRFVERDEAQLQKLLDWADGVLQKRKAPAPLK